MPTLALASWIVYVAIAFVLRTALQLRRTGSSGFVGLRPGAGLLERGAGAAMVLAFAAPPVGAFVGTPLLPPWSVAPGLALVALGTIGTFVAQLGMRDAWRIGVDPQAQTELVTTGMFRWVRNPIFTMMIVASLGLGLVCATPILLAAPLLLTVALQLQVRIVEEPWLRARHGARYLAWARRTGRFVPGLGCLPDDGR